MAAGIFLDNVAETGSSPSRLICQDYTLLLHKTAEPVQTSRLVLMWTKMGVFTASPRPNPFTMTVSTDFAAELPRFHSQRLEAGRSAAHQLHFCASYRPVIYRARTNIQWKEGSGLGWRQVKPGNICPFKGISSLVCSESTPGVLALHW